MRCGDPDVVEARLEVLAFNQLEGLFWDQGIELDPDALEKTRRMQKVYLARYARQGFFEWESREVVELQRYFEALADIIGRENDMTRRNEER